MKALITFLFMAFSLVVYAQNLSIPDANFKNVLTNTHCVDTNNNGSSDADADTNNDGEIQVSEALAVINLDVSYENISSLSGIEYFTNLQKLYCNNNFTLTSLNLQGLTNLRKLYCNNTYTLGSLNLQGCTNLQELYCQISQISSLNLQGFTNLETLNCSQNPISTLNVQGCINLETLNCSQNSLTILDVQGLTSLRTFDCSNNQLASLNVQGCAILRNLNCQINYLTSLNVQGLINLWYLYCSDNELTSLNVQGCINLQDLYCNNNQLTSLYIKNGTLEMGLDFNNPNLVYICCDVGQLTQVQNLVTQYGLTNCTINSYCTNFTPNGVFYTLQGNVLFDSNNNGCDSLDIAYSNLVFNITNGIDFGVFISNNFGHYYIPVLAGTHSITPVLQNPNYFNITPASTQINFPSVSNPATQNYCITTNGIHHDVEATVIPIMRARPGFDATYRIIYKNKGTEVENGNLTFTFDDSRLDFISASINPDYQATDSLLWNYTNLMPFETRTINLVLNVNSPAETPPVNVGDILDFSVAIRGGQPEETPGDNNTGLRQIVVGSLDPNDKTCLEGNEITPSMVGDYLHYLIRFENTGTYAAENVVVKDIIDTSKFEISTLQIVDASHPMWTRITAGNIVEFIFENIQLPFDPATNDGYVTFKIKTKPTLELGDQVTNFADIYFDYNLPITTNTATTDVVSDVDPTNLNPQQQISIFPNPVHDFLTFQSDAVITKVEVYDAMGRLVQVSTLNNNRLSVEKLSNGIYFLNVYTESGLMKGRVVKE